MHITIHFCLRQNQRRLPNLFQQPAVWDPASCVSFFFCSGTQSGANKMPSCVCVCVFLPRARSSEARNTETITYVSYCPAGVSTKAARGEAIWLDSPHLRDTWWIELTLFNSVGPVLSYTMRTYSTAAWTTSLKHDHEYRCRVRFTERLNDWLEDSRAISHAIHLLSIVWLVWSAAI